MIAKILTNKTIQLTNITAWEEEIVDKRFSAMQPNARFIDLSGGSSWDGVYRKYNRGDKTIARPFLGELRALCKDKDLALVVEDKRKRSKYKPIDKSLITEDFLPGIKLKPFQIDAIKTIYNAEVGIINVSMGGGKCLGEGTPIIYYDGTIKSSEDVCVGDILMGDDSTPRRVLAISKGVGPLFRVNQKYGDSFVVNKHHQLSVIKMARNRKKQWTRRNIEVKASDYAVASNSFKNLCKGYKTSVEFANQNPPIIDPYLLGVWLGDGKSSDLQFFLSEQSDAAIVSYLQNYCDANNYILIKYDTPNKDCDTYCIRLYSGIHAPTKTIQNNRLKRTFRKLDLLNNKHIPHKFKTASKTDRLKLLAGLIDADGYTNERNDTLYITLKKTILVDDTVFLARSLGFRVTCKDTYKTDGNGFGDYYSRITISGHVNTIPCLVVKKQCKPRRINKDPLRYAIDVEPIGSGQYYGFQLDGNGRFLLGDFTVTHNSEMIAGICKALPCPTAIIAEQIQVIDQLKSRLKLRDVCSEPGLFYAGKMPAGELIIIGSIQSLVKPKKRPEKPLLENFKNSKSGTAEKKFERAMANYEIKIKAFRSRTKKAEALHKLIGACEMIIVDEADLATSTTYKHLFRYWFKGRRRYGMTGTPYDDDKPVEKLVLQEHFGSVIYTQNREDVEKVGLTVPVSYYALAYGEDGHKDEASAFDIAIDEMMVHSEKFHKFIAALCKRFTNEGTLILVERDDLGYALQKLIPDSDFIHGKTTRKRRPEILKAFEDRKLKVLIGGKNVRRGMDLKGGCENLILATGGKLSSEFKQRVGRAARLNQKGSARVFDIYFLCNKYLYAHSRKRVKAAVTAGYASKVIFKDGSIDGDKFIKSRFHKPKAKKSKDLPGQKKLF